jgi:hypothetical protein
MPRGVQMKKLGAALAVATITHLPAFADTWQCVESSDGHIYKAQQSVPGDECTLIAKTPESEESKKIHAMMAIPLDERTTFPRIGMRALDVMLSRWGAPQHTNKTTSARGTSEQWVYGDGKYLYFENGILTAIQE